MGFFEGEQTVEGQPFGYLRVFKPPETPSVLFFLATFTPKTSNSCLKNRALGFPGTKKKLLRGNFWNDPPGVSSTFFEKHGL